MTIQDRLDEAERILDELQLKTYSSQEGRRAIDALMHREPTLLERPDVAQLDIGARLDRVEAILESDNS